MRITHLLGGEECKEETWAIMGSDYKYFSCHVFPKRNSYMNQNKCVGRNIFMMSSGMDSHSRETGDGSVVQ